jgi:hypothetical protein
MAQVVSRRPLAADALVRSRANPRGNFGERSGIGTVFLLVPRFSPVNKAPPGRQTHVRSHLRDEQ